MMYCCCSSETQNRCQSLSDCVSIMLWAPAVDNWLRSCCCCHISWVAKFFDIRFLWCPDLGFWNNVKVCVGACMQCPTACTWFQHSKFRLYLVMLPNLIKMSGSFLTMIGHDWVACQFWAEQKSQEIKINTSCRLKDHAHPAAGEGLWGSQNEVPSFLYAMPSKTGHIFLEETCLVAKPALPFATLKRRLYRRLDAMGLKASTHLSRLISSCQKAWPEIWNFYSSYWLQVSVNPSPH